VLGAGVDGWRCQAATSDPAGEVAGAERGSLQEQRQLEQRLIALVMGGGSAEAEGSNGDSDSAGGSVGGSVGGNASASTHRCQCRC
jgi:hypothetical protein